MPRMLEKSRSCFWTRKLELQLVDFVREREYIWKPVGNTNHHIQQKYKAYAEFAALLGKGFTARSVRDRWVNIRSTFNHNMRKIEQARLTAQTEAELYVPSWPLWKPLQFLRNAGRKDNEYNDHHSTDTKVRDDPYPFEDLLIIRQGNKRTDRPRRKLKSTKKVKKSKCKKVIDDLVIAMKPLTNHTSTKHQSQSYWFFGKHVAERLNAMRDVDAECARQEIVRVLKEIEENEEPAWGDSQ